MHSTLAHCLQPMVVIMPSLMIQIQDENMCTFYQSFVHECIMEELLLVTQITHPFFS